MRPVEIARGTRVVVTGASRGIGRAIAQAFAVRDCEVGLMARAEEELEELALALPGEGHEALPADVGDPEQVRAALADWGPVDVLVANAGVADYGPFRDMTLDQVERMTRVNWLGTAYTIHAALPGMLDRARGHIVVVSSGAGLRSFPFAAVYGATKSAQRGFAEALRHELSGTGVSLTTVYPGEVESHLHDHAASLPDWNARTNGAGAAPVEPLATAVVDAVENDARDIYYPRDVRLLRVAHGLSPKLADRLLRRIRGGTAAPRAD
jgi:short-subunit dehydrogenase